MSPDIFARPSSDEVGKQRTADIAATIHGIDPLHPVTCGLHIASLLKNNGLRVDQVFSKMDFAVMHAYPMYSMPLANSPLDTEFVPFTCALTAELSEKPVLIEEFGGCTVPPGKGSFHWIWKGHRHIHRQFMASEEAMADDFEKVLPKLVEVGAQRALVWCFADYHPCLWDKLPCSEYWNERHFGLVRPDGSLKPHAEVIRTFAATKPQVTPAKRTVMLPYSSAEYYQYTPIKIWKLYKQGSFSAGR